VFRVPPIPAAPKSIATVLPLAETVPANDSSVAPIP
jgi:hypothetical protein